jgi:NADPH-dependent 2,4-dienoyl-CoA reductase/sulfur reductase-like enzyme
MHIAIIGNGISGITAARWIRKLSDHKVTVISGESEYFFSRTALMYMYMGHMRLKDTQPYEPWFWKKNRIDLKKAWVSKIDFSNKVLTYEGGDTLSYDKLILALGSSSNKFGWPGQDLEGVHGLYSLQDLEAMEYHSPGLKRAVIVGGGLIGIEMAEMFHSRHIPVTMLIREESYWNNVLPREESEMINRHILEHGIDMRLSTELKEIHDDGNGKANAVTTNKGDTITCGFVGLTAGVHPNLQLVKNSPIETQNGIMVDGFLQTNIPDVYAIGDCAQIREPRTGRRPVEAIWYTGRMMGETVAYNLCNRPVEYDPGLWFNSAKFFDIEYQVYGNVQANPPDHHASIYWEAEDGKRSIRVVYDKNTSAVLGFNLMGVRYRHEVCEKWILEGTPVHEVMTNLSLANFDPEFYTADTLEVVRQYEKVTGKTISPQKKKSWDQVFHFLKS